MEAPPLMFRFTGSMYIQVPNGRLAVTGVLSSIGLATSDRPKCYAIWTLTVVPFGVGQVLIAELKYYANDLYETFRTMSTNPNASSHVAELAIKNAFQLSKIAQFCASCFRLSSEDEAIKGLKETLQDMGISGYLSVYGINFIKAAVGKGIQELNLERVPRVDDGKITQFEDGFTYQGELLRFIYNGVGVNPEQRGLSCDNVTILLDYFDQLMLWRREKAEVHAAQERRNQNSIEQLISLINTSADISWQNMQEMCQGVYSKLMMLLPRLGLDLDQEEQIISLVGRIVEDYRHCVEIQEKNKELILGYFNDNACLASKL